jgi:hypothetical protein
MKQWLLECADRGGYDTWADFTYSLKDAGRDGREDQFIRDMIRSTAAGIEPTVRQRKWLQDIHERVLEGLSESGRPQ